VSNAIEGQHLTFIYSAFMGTTMQSIQKILLKMSLILAQWT
jgi:hypothetical protein